MKTLLSVVLLLSMIVCAGWASPAGAVSFKDVCKFSWNANTEADLAGYRAWVDKGGVQKPIVNVPVSATPNVSCAALGVDTDGNYTFNVVAHDNAQTANVSTASAIVGTRDTVVPETTITPTITGSTASFVLASNEPGVTFQCQLDAAAFGQCTSPRVYTGLTDGPHTFAARAADAAGNMDASNATHAWTINMQAPAQPSGLTITPNFP